ncbi:MAG: transcription termination/antitermination protein NusA [Thermicanus sp.]|nr:transcription termination/antitermination protein NusA [Thermicanus sp.]
MRIDFMSALAELEKEKGIGKEVLIEAMKQALIAAYKKNYNSAQNVQVEVNEETGDVSVYARKKVVEEVTDPRLEISLETAREINPHYQVDDTLDIEVTPRDFGRIAAQTAKQVVTQRIREAERGIIFKEYVDREEELILGTVQRFDGKNIYVELGKTEGILPYSEILPGEEFHQGDRLKAFIVRVEKGQKAPQILLSRTNPGFLKRLFEREVPEIYEGIVEIKSIAREAGDRSKVAVHTKDEHVDPVGACVGPKGSRVQTIVQELKGEKIDIVRWSEDPVVYVANALSPAKVLSVEVMEGEKKTRVIVPDHQLSLAIGKRGQNARLAAKLTGWKVDIKSESQAEEEGILPRAEQDQEPYDEEDQYIEEIEVSFLDRQSREE